MAEHADAADGRVSVVRPVLAAGVIALLAVAGVAGWLGFSAYQSQQDQHEREVLLQVARQTALNLTTIDHSQAEADVQRILDAATGAFHDDFQSRSTEFVEVVKKAQSKSEGTIVESGLESKSGDEAQVLVAVNVTSVNGGAADADPRGWRMRLTVQKTADAAKVSNVEFVP